MNNFFLYYVDVFALAASLVLAALLTMMVSRRTAAPLRLPAVFFLFFGPSAILIHMSCHILQISYNAVLSSLDGEFVYNFRFYSLMLMAGVIIYLNQQLLVRLKVFLEDGYFGPVLRVMFRIVLVSAPTIAFTLIGLLPTVACIISLAALP